MIDDFIITLFNYYYNFLTFEYAGDMRFLLAKILVIPIILLYSFPWIYIFQWIFTKLSYLSRFWVSFFLINFLLIGDVDLLITIIFISAVYFVYYQNKKLDIKPKILYLSAIAIIVFQMPMLLAKNYIVFKSHYYDNVEVSILDKNIDKSDLAWNEYISFEKFKEKEAEYEYTYPLSYRVTKRIEIPYGKEEGEIYLKKDERLVAKYSRYLSGKSTISSIYNMLVQEKKFESNKKRELFIFMKLILIEIKGKLYE